MGLRNGRKIDLTIAAAMISHLVRDRGEYLAVKEEIREKVLDLASKIAPDYEVNVYVNTGDKPEKDIVYLTVTGTSSEHGDDGMTGRGNRANGLITPLRPMSLEATAGKNPVNHVGKIYNVVANDLAKTIYNEVKDIKEVYVKILSQIGRPIDDPLVADVKVKPFNTKLTNDQKNEISSIVEDVLSNITAYTEKIVNGEVQLF
jgi:S-adenosylmethionine synthetase